MASLSENAGAKDTAADVVRAIPGSAFFRGTAKDVLYLRKENAKWKTTVSPLVTRPKARMVRNTLRRRDPLPPADLARKKTPADKKIATAAAAMGLTITGGDGYDSISSAADTLGGEVEWSKLAQLGLKPLPPKNQTSRAMVLDPQTTLHVPLSPVPPGNNPDQRTQSPAAKQQAPAAPTPSLPSAILSMQSKRFRDHLTSTLRAVGLRTQPAATSTTPIFHCQTSFGRQRSFLTDHRILQPQKTPSNAASTANAAAGTMHSMANGAAHGKPVNTDRRLEEHQNAMSGMKAETIGQKRSASTETLSNTSAISSAAAAASALSQGTQQAKRAKASANHMFERKQQGAVRPMNNAASMEEVKQKAARAVHQQRAQMEGQQKVPGTGRGQTPRQNGGAASGPMTGSNMQMAANNGAAAIAVAQKGSNVGPVPIGLMQQGVQPNISQAPLQIRPQVGNQQVNASNGNDIANMNAALGSTGVSSANSNAAVKAGKGKTGPLAAAKGRNAANVKGGAAQVNSNNMQVQPPQVLPTVVNPVQGAFMPRMVGRGNSNMRGQPNAAQGGANFQMIHPMQSNQNRNAGRGAQMLVPQVPMSGMAMGTMNPPDYLAMLNRSMMMNPGNAGAQPQTQQVNAPVLAPSPAAPKQGSQGHKQQPQQSGQQMGTQQGQSSQQQGEQMTTQPGAQKHHPQQSQIAQQHAQQMMQQQQQQQHMHQPDAVQGSQQSRTMQMPSPSVPVDSPSAKVVDDALAEIDEMLAMTPPMDQDFGI
ncbi:hypothetical protein NDN08_000795 [Rhodosorus marinus]|uniref:Uncharacterized protein n=1 Tax=Rhodosorus marinus TaxID=101924 RepID=A0AAV8UT14_9RHOD|nr:hypothetical protein NDN08_000795 [Rhodosorus marinus]